MVEPFHFGVLPGALWLDECVRRVQGGDRGGHVVGVTVAPVVVGHDPFDPVDAVGGEVVGGTAQECRAGGSLLVGQDLGVGERERSSIREWTKS